MSVDERQQMWQERIDAYSSSDAPSIKAWCKQNEVGVQSMYSWMKRLETEPTRIAQPYTQWVAIDPSHSIEDAATLSVQVGDVSIEIKEGFSHLLFTEVLQLLQSHVK